MVHHSSTTMIVSSSPQIGSSEDSESQQSSHYSYIGFINEDDVEVLIRVDQLNFQD